MSNDQIILDEVLEQQHALRAPRLPASEYFELFTTEQVLKDFDLSDDEIESGLVGDGRDGGIDSIFLFANGELVRDDFDASHLKKDIVLELVIIQSKTSVGFQETPIERFITVSDDVLDLSKPVDTLVGVYNPGLLDAITRFRETYRSLAAKFPRLKISYYYACRGARPEPTVLRKAEKLKESVRNRIPSADVTVEFVGATELLMLARRATKTTFTLVLAENPVSSAGEVGFVCLVSLSDYYQFITDDRKHLRRQIFEANVRDYQGRTEVNDEIQSTLKQRDAEDFWWLNNGVTIVSSRASLSAKTLTIEDPQIVNGLQTSTEVFHYYSTSKTDGDQRKLLVRVIVPTNVASRDRIIKATNSQTAVQQASLRATDKIHRDIEEFLRPRNLFYDRRKNFYKNEGKPLDRIIGIPQLGQATMAVILARPDTARARPSSLLKDDADYTSVFNPQYPVGVYYVCAEVLKRVETVLREEAAFDARDRNNLRFYVAMQAVYRALGLWRPQPHTVARLDPTTITIAAIRESIRDVKQAYDGLGGGDRVAKGSELLEALEHGFAGGAASPGI